MEFDKFCIWIHRKYELSHVALNIILISSTVVRVYFKFLLHKRSCVLHCSLQILHKVSAFEVEVEAEVFEFFKYRWQNFWCTRKAFIVYRILQPLHLKEPWWTNTCRSEDINLNTIFRLKLDLYLPRWDWQPNLCLHILHWCNRDWFPVLCPFCDC